MITTLKNISIEGSHGKPVLLDLFYADDTHPKALVIFSHGFKGFKDWGHFNLLGERFAAAGLSFLKFNFSHNGTTPQDPEHFTDLQAFGNNNYIIELDDLKDVIDWVTSDKSPLPEWARRKIFLLGHSRGGGISILKAGEDPRVSALATWASVSNLTNRNKKRTIDTWKRDGVVYAHNSRTGQDMPLFLQFYESTVKNRKRLNVLRAARSLQIPFLIAHGTADDAVPVTEAQALHTSARHSHLLVFENADHTFGVKHPFTGDLLPPHAEDLVKQTTGFFKQYI